MQKLTRQGIVDISDNGYILEISGVLLSQVKIGYNTLIIKYWTPIDSIFYTDEQENWYSFLANRCGKTTDDFKKEFLFEMEKVKLTLKKRDKKEKPKKEKEKVKKSEIKKESYLEKIRNNANNNK